jgi:hypothetical protein
MYTLLKLLGVAALASLLSSNLAGAAQITCIWHYGDGGKGAESEVWPPGFRPKPEACRKARIMGNIENGDYQRYLAFYRLHHPVLTNLQIVSPGGDAEEAMKIGRLVRKYLLTVEAPFYNPHNGTSILSGGDLAGTVCQGPSCVCASACALIWFGAISRTGRVGLHRPRIVHPDYTALPVDAASAVYRRVLDEISRYLEEMEVPRPLIDAMVATSSADIRWVDGMDSTLDKQLEQPPSVVEWLAASCGYNPREEREWLLLATDIGKRWSEEEARQFSLLGERTSKASKCIRELIHNRRDALPAP